MSLNKNALIRYKTIDKCLQNIYRQWTLDDLIQACSEALYEYEGRHIDVSKRSVQLDLQMMRSDKLGYNAPIVVYDKKFYKYEDENYSITNIPITENDINVLSETVQMLKQFKDFSLFSELTGIIQKLEDKIYTEKTHQASIIYLDKNENLKGLEHLDVLYQAILKRVCLNLKYQSFRAQAASEIILHPLILKQFNNRWFIVGRNHKAKTIITLALDRIIKIDFDFSIPCVEENFDGDEFYKDTIGVTVLNEFHVKEILLKLDKENAPYVLTKPFHHSQKLVENFSDGSITIQIKVHLNMELERVILGFGSSIEVLEPKVLRNRIKQKLERACNFYREEARD